MATKKRAVKKAASGTPHIPAEALGWSEAAAESICSNEVIAELPEFEVVQGARAFVISYAPCAVPKATGEPTVEQKRVATLRLSPTLADVEELIKALDAEYRDGFRRMQEEIDRLRAELGPSYLGKRDADGDHALKTSSEEEAARELDATAKKVEAEVEAEVEKRVAEMHTRIGRPPSYEQRMKIRAEITAERNRDWEQRERDKAMQA